MFRVEDDPVAQGWLLVLGLVGTCLAVAFPIAEARESHSKIAELEKNLTDAKAAQTKAVEDAKREGRAEFLLILDFAIRPLLEKLGPLVRSRLVATKNKLATELKGMAISALKEVIDPSIRRLRANYYKLEYPGGRPILQDAISTATAPRSRFDLGDETVESDAILAMLASSDYVFTADWEEDPPPGFDVTKKRSYRTFISASASDGMDVDGMISVDSPEAGSLTEADATLVQLVGTIIAISEAVRDGKKNDTED